MHLESSNPRARVKSVRTKSAPRRRNLCTRDRIRTVRRVHPCRIDTFDPDSYLEDIDSDRPSSCNQVWRTEMYPVAFQNQRSRSDLDRMPDRRFESYLCLSVGVRVLVSSNIRVVL